MKKRFVVVFLALALAVFSAGCGGENTSSSDVQSTSSSASSTSDTSSTAEVVYEEDVSSFVKLGKYKGIEVSKIDTTVTNEEIEAQIKTDMEDVATSSEITDGTVENGDIVNIDYKGMIDGEAFEGGTAEGADLTIGSHRFIDDFEEQLIGMKKGEKKTITVTFPDPYTPNTDMSGKDADFDVTINKITRLTYPELTDDVVAEISDEKTVEDYKAAVKENLQLQKENTALSQKKSSVWATVSENATIESYPEQEVEDYANRMIQYYKDMVAQMGMEFSDYLQNYMGITEETFASQAQLEAEGWVGNYLLARAIAKEEGITVNDEEYQKNLQDLVDAGQFTSLEAAENVYGENIWKGNFLIEKVVEFVVENAVEV